MKPHRRLAVSIVIVAVIAAVTAGSADAAAKAREVVKPIVTRALQQDVSPPLWLIQPPAPVAAQPREINPIKIPDILNKRTRPQPLARDPLVGRQIPGP